jgi:hypothetical protein
MLIVITLVATALGALAIPMSKALKGEQFERGVDRVIGKLTLSQELMLDFRTDVRLHIYQDLGKGEIVCKLSPKRPLPKHIEKGLNRYASIKGIEKIVFNGQQDPIELDFDGTVGKTPKGTLTLFSHNNREESIILKGYPSQIKRGIHDQKSDCQATYPEEIVSLI